MQRSMAVQWVCRRPRVSQCPEWHKKVKPMSESDMSDQKSDEVPVTCTDVMHGENEARGTVGSADGAQEASDWMN